MWGVIEVTKGASPYWSTLTVILKFSSSYKIDDLDSCYCVNTSSNPIFLLFYCLLKYTANNITNNPTNE